MKDNDTAFTYKIEYRIWNLECRIFKTAGC
jgi:hypothetical protein